MSSVPLEDFEELYDLVSTLRAQLTNVQAELTATREELNATLSSVEQDVGLLRSIVPVVWRNVNAAAYTGMPKKGMLEIDVSPFAVAGEWISGHVHGTGGHWCTNWQGSIYIATLDANGEVFDRDGYGWVKHHSGSGAHGSCSFSFSVRTDPTVVSPTLWLVGSGTQHGGETLSVYVDRVGST